MIRFFPISGWGLEATYNWRAPSCGIDGFLTGRRRSHRGMTSKHRDIITKTRDRMMKSPSSVLDLCVFLNIQVYPSRIYTYIYMDSYIQ